MRASVTYVTWTRTIKYPCRMLGAWSRVWYVPDISQLF